MKTTTIAWGVIAATVLTACGIERNIIEDLSGTAREKVRPLTGTMILGKHGLSGTPTVKVVTAAGDGITGAKVTVKGATYEAQLPDGIYQNLLVVGASGAAVLERIVPALSTGQQIQNFDLTVDSTTVTLVIEAALSARLNSLVLQRGQATDGMVTALMQQTGTGGNLASLNAAVGRVFAAAGVAGTAPSLGQPVLDTSYASTTSAVGASWLAGASVDLDGDGTNDTTTKPFDDILTAAARALQLCKDPTYVRSIFAVNFNAGQKDGKCRAIDRFKWVKDEPGKRMFFVGGVHKESPMQDDVIQVLLGNWSPNQIAMYDDGTHGDQVAADNVWSVTFDLPATMRIGYKYTWGKQGSAWTGSEEWPGNQRILQISDWNTDSYVYRYDNFGDEATNKDKVNSYGSDVNITWDTDLNGDGIPEAVEQKIDPTNSCLPGSWTTPSWIGPAVVYCG